MDLHDLDHNTDNGLHLASLAGVWLALVAGMGGLRDRVDHGLAFAPRLPEGMDRLRFGVVHGDAQLRVDVTAEKATYSVEKGSEITVSHHGEEFVLSSDEPVSMPMPANPSLPRPQQPPGREPRTRRSSLVSGPLGR
jgi:alpha,alpha-trehalose phosphorylase